MDSNHRRRKPAELQSAPFGHSGNCPLVLNCSAKVRFIFETCKRLGRKIYHFYCGNRCLVPFIAISTSRTILGLLHGVGS